MKQHTAYDDWRGKTTSVPLRNDAPDNLPAGVSFGQAMPLEKSHYAKDDIVSVSFWSSNPIKNFGFDKNFLAIEQKQNNVWVTVFTDHDWSTKIWWEADSDAYTAQVSWQIPDAVKSGEYRIRHFGQYTDVDGEPKNYVGASDKLFVK